MNTLARHLLAPQRLLALVSVLSISLASPLSAWAQSVDATGNTTGAPACTGAGCTQGLDQGFNQGFDQGGPTIEDLGGTTDEAGNTVLPEGVTNTTQGAQQGLTNGITATNTSTGADSTNQTNATTASTANTGVTNAVNDTTNATATAGTGTNTSSQNTGTGSVTTGNAGIGVTQVKNDNSTVLGGTAGLTVSGHNGDYNGDLNLGFGTGTANLTNGTSVQAVNDTTGSNSTNGIDVTTTTNQLTEVQNDGEINNLLDLAAITGQNETNSNTGGGTINTGDANVAATLVNLLNTTVIDGSLWVTVADIFGDLNGNINLPDFATFMAAMESNGLNVDASNDGTGANSTNDITVNASDTETTNVNNDADINTTVNANAITGQNETLSNTGGATVNTGDGNVSASNISVANTTVEGGNWGLVIVNALNGWLGFLVGDSGQVQALSQEETLRQIDAQNSNTGSNSDNTIAVTDEHNQTTNVNNDATINNVINADAITGQNEASMNTGAAEVTTGDANVQATAVNIANTTVKNGSLFVAVVNVFGDWFGDLLYGGQSLSQLAAAQGASSTVNIDANNTETGANSDNTIDVNYDRTHTTNVDNEADLNTTLNANIDTGSNRANRNTGGADITTGDGLLALHSRAAANLTAIAGPSGVAVNVQGLNDTTGFDSTNRINARINDDRIIDVDNNANVSTVFAGVANTGNNEANQNTLAARIVTGNIDAAVAIQNMVNQVLLALAGEGITVDADFANQLTGALSDNTNDLTVAHSLLLNIANAGVVDNIINLLLNTGGNHANMNTGGGDISTGAICVDGVLTNDVNSYHKGAKGGSLTLIQDASITNDANVQATTGSNQANQNTGPSGDAKSTDDCEKLAMVPSPTPEASPTPDGEGGGNGGGDDGDDEGEEGVGGGDVSEERAPRVAGAVTPQIKPSQILKRFPVAGAEQAAQILQGKKRLPWQLFLALSVGLLGGAWALDRRAHSKHLGQLA